MVDVVSYDVFEQENCQDVVVELVKEEESGMKLGRKSVCADDSYPQRKWGRSS